MKRRNRYQLALDVQDAVNLLALSHAFVEVVTEAYEQNSGTVYLRDDPAVILFVNKLESMCLSNERFSQAYDACLKRACCPYHGSGGDVGLSCGGDVAR